MYQMTFHALDLLNGNNINKFGKLLHEAWMIKREMSDKVSTKEIDAIYNTAKSAGALGGKLLGAGGGGFLLVFAAPGAQKKIREKLKNLLLVPFEFENLGTQIIFFQPNSDYQK